MNSIRFFALSACMLLLTGCATSRRDRLDPDIQNMVRDIDPQKIESHVKTLVGFGTRNTMSETESQTRGIGAARRWIRDEFKRISAANGNRLVVEMDGYHQEPDGRRIVKSIDILNVLATLPGSQPQSADRIYIVSGHYDSICSDGSDFTCDAPGADDDASGVAAVLELARVMSKHKFDATIVFMAVAGEEQGLLGSAYQAKKSRERGDNIEGMLTNDIIGNSLSADGVRDRKHVRLFSENVPMNETPEQAEIRKRVGNEHDSQARQLARAIDRECDRYVSGFDVVLINRLDRFLRGGDHKSYALAGYPGVRFTEMNEDYRHQHQNVRIENGVQYGDLPEFVDYDYIADVARVNAAGLATLARAPAPPKNVRVITAKLTTDTTLRWDANTEPDHAGYVIVWRETTSSQWQWSKHVGKITEVTLPFSKDNYIFGVAAIDREGHQSRAVYPLPARE